MGIRLLQLTPFYLNLVFVLFCSQGFAQSIPGSSKTLAQIVPVTFFQKGNPCDHSPAIGTVCKDGAIYAGIFDGGKYMITPGNCTDSATPVCNGTEDTLTKTFRGSGGSNTDIPTVNNDTVQANPSQPSARGDVVTPLIAADASIDSDSAADYCLNMTFGGFSDWTLPAKSEISYLYCKADVGNHDTTHPEEDPNCLYYGGKTSELTDFAGVLYNVAAEFGANTMGARNFDTGAAQLATKGSGRSIRCIRRYGEDSVDKFPDSIAWSNFTGSSSTETFSKFESVIFLEITAANNTGTPTLEYNRDSAGWVSFTAGTTTHLEVRDGTTLQFRATGTSGHAATITIKNGTIDSAPPTLDTVTATVP